MMKILQINSVPIQTFGGMERVILDISSKLSKENEVTVLQTNLYYPKIREGRKLVKGIEIITCKNDFFFRGYGYSRSFKKKLKEIWSSFDIVHIHGTGRFTSDFSLKFLKGKKPIIFTSHGFYHSKRDNYLKKLQAFFNNKLLGNASFVTALTPLEVTEYLRKGVKKERIAIIPNGVDFNRFSRKRKYQNIKEHTPRLLYVGRTHESKGLKEILTAIKDLKVEFFIAGVQTDYKKELEKLIRELDIEKKIKFFNQPSDSELSKLFSSCDCFILFSQWEGFGLVAIEAMSFGKPVISSNRGSLPLLVKENFNGMVVEYPKVDKLKKTINTLITNKKLIERLGKNALKFSKEFSWEKIIGKYEELYLRAIRKK